MNNGKKHELEGGIILEYGPVTVDKVGESLSEGRLNVQLRQVVKKIYPGIKGHDSMSDGLFDGSEFKGGGAGPFEQNRVAFLPAPIGTTVEDVKKRLDSCECPTLVRFLDLQPILTEEQRRSIETGLNKKTEDEYRNTQAIQDGKGNKIPWVAPDQEIYEQYGVTKFSTTFMEDQDNRLGTWKENQEEKRVSVSSGNGLKKTQAAPAGASARQ